MIIKSSKLKEVISNLPNVYQTAFSKFSFDSAMNEISNKANVDSNIRETVLTETLIFLAHLTTVEEFESEIRALTADSVQAQTIIELIDELIIKPFFIETMNIEEIDESDILMDEVEQLLYPKEAIDIDLSNMPIKKTQPLTTELKKQNPILNKLHVKTSTPTKKSDKSHIPPSGYTGTDPYHEEV
jgi:hypothetical protein